MGTLLAVSVVGFVIASLCILGLSVGIGWYVCVLVGKATTWLLCAVLDVLASEVWWLLAGVFTIALTAAFAGFVLALVIVL